MKISPRTIKIIKIMARDILVTFAVIAAIAGFIIFMGHFKEAAIIIIPWFFGIVVVVLVVLFWWIQTIERIEIEEKQAENNKLNKY